MSKWDEATTCKFVCEYRKHEILWNVKNDLYRNRKARESSYISLLQNMNLPTNSIGDIKNKIKSLRSTYQQELKKMQSDRTRGIGKGAPYVPSVKWFGDMADIMRDSVSKRSSTDGLKNEFSFKMEEVDDSFGMDNDADSDYMMDDDKQPIESIWVNPKNTKIDLSDMGQFPQVSSPVLPEDEFDLFAKNIAAQLRQLPLQVALDVQIKMQELVAKERIAQIKRDAINGTIATRPPI